MADDTEQMSLLMTLVVELHQAENSGKREEDQHRVQQDEPRDAKPSDVCKSCISRILVLKKTLYSPNKTHNVTRCLDCLLQPSSPAVHQATGTIPTPNVARMTRIAVYGTVSGYCSPDLNSKPPLYPDSRPARPTSIFPSGGCTSK